MPRVKSNVARLKRKNKIMKLAKGYFGGRSKLWKAAKESVERAQKYAYRDRRRRKADFRRRTNAGSRISRPRSSGAKPAHSPRFSGASRSSTRLPEKKSARRRTR